MVQRSIRISRPQAYSIVLVTVPVIVTQSPTSFPGEPVHGVKVGAGSMPLASLQLTRLPLPISWLPTSTAPNDPGQGARAMIPPSIV